MGSGLHGDEPHWIVALLAAMVILMTCLGLPIFALALAAQYGG